MKKKSIIIVTFAWRAIFSAHSSKIRLSLMWKRRAERKDENKKQ